MSAFKDMVASDNDSVFFSDSEEFWEPHNVNGTAMRCMLDSDELISRRAGKVLTAETEALYTGRYLMYVRASDFGPRPALGALIVFDGKRRRVVSVDSEAGVYVIEMEAVRT